MFTALSKIGGTLEDITRYTKKYGEQSTPLTVSIGDAIYLGTRLKFNHAFIKLNTPSVESLSPKVSLWDGNQFTEVARLIDETDGLTASGMLEFSPDAKKSWSRKDSEDIAEINTIKYYDLYWLKIEFEAAGSIDIDFIGHKFSNDFDLFAEWPQLNNPNFLAYFSQPDYEKQAIKAAELVEKSLIKQGIIESTLEVLEWSDLSLASVSKVAEIIYGSFGNEYADNVTSLRSEYNSRINTAFPITDKNNTAIKDNNPRVTKGQFYR